MSANKCEKGGSVYLGCALEVDYFGSFSILLDIPRQINAGKARSVIRDGLRQSTFCGLFKLGL